MNHIIVFMLVIFMYFCLNEVGIVTIWRCKENILEFCNELIPDSVLKVNCTSKDDITDIHDLVFNSRFELKFGEHMHLKKQYGVVF